MKRFPAPLLALALLVSLLSTATPAPASVSRPASASQSDRRPEKPATDDGFRYRGVIEGFYGRPWARRDRVPLLRWMADHGMNLYVHAPKTDPYQRLRWRRPYPESTMRQFRHEISTVTPLGLSWVPSISPGFPLLEAAEPHDEDICFSCPRDRRVLFRKLDPFWRAGVRTFMVSFDDVVKVSTHPEDAATYGAGDYAYGLANADLLNAVLRRYRSRDPGFRLITVPADYFGTTTTPYLEGLRSKLDRRVTVMWTGTEVVSPTVDCESARKYAAAVGRKPLLWDNFPVNDYATDKLMIGPYKGRAPDLPECLSGVLANPALQARTNKLPLYTVADYLKGPARYRPEKSWRRGIREFAGGQAALLRPFVENVRSTALDRTESVRLTRSTRAFIRSLDHREWPASHQRLVRLLREYAATPRRLRRDFRDQRFIAEIENGPSGSWLARLGFGARNGLEAAGYLAATRPRISAELRDGVLAGRVLRPMTPSRAQRAHAAVSTMSRRDDGNPENVYGDRGFFALGRTYVNENRMDRFYRSASAELAEYLPSAARASADVSLRVNGRRVEVRGDGYFRVRVGPRAMAVAVDGIGHLTKRVFRQGPT